MLIRELILHHVGDGTVHQRGYALPLTQTTGIRLHPVGAEVEPAAGDLLLLSARVDRRFDVVPADLPEGTTVVLLVPTEPARLPVGRVIHALLGAGLKIIEAVVASGTRQPTVAVVARRSDVLVLPEPYLARELEPPIHSSGDQSTDVLARVLAESVLENLGQRARERELLAELGDAEERQREAERVRAESEPLLEELATVKAERNALKAERNALKKRLGQVESSTTYRLASTLARASGRVRRRIPRLGT